MITTSVAPLLEQVAGQCPDRVGAQRATMPVRVQEDVDGGVAVVLLVLLPVLDKPDHLPVGLDGEGRCAVVEGHQLSLDPVKVKAASTTGATAGW
jgi:hypothetical protein